MCEQKLSVFSADYWRAARRELNNPRVLAFSGLVCAMAIVLESLPIYLLVLVCLNRSDAMPVRLLGSLVVAVLFLWLLLKAVGVFDQVTQIFSSAGLDSGSINLSNILSLPTVLSAVTIFSIVEMVIITILCTIFALLYNVVSALVGGVHVTLGDD